MMEISSYAPLSYYDEADKSSATAVRMLVENPVNEGKIILVVEGDDDREVYGRLVIEDKVEIYADGNCDKHSEILATLNSLYSERLAAIKDADFDHLNGTVYPHANMYLTDLHDLENMILAEGIPESVKKKYNERMQGYTIEEIMNDLEVASYLKWYNSRKEHDKLRFKGLKWCDFYGDGFTVEVDDLFEKAKANTNNEITWTMADVEAFVKENPDQDCKQLCRGHDIFECLYIRAKCKDPKHNFQKKKFFRDLRDSYTIDKFSSTNLYSNLRKIAIVG